MNARPPDAGPPNDRPKPLWRFGRAGWCALAAGSPIVVMAAVGYNPAYEAQRLVMEHWGWPALTQFTTWGLVYPNMQLTGIAVGPIALAWVLLAFGLSPGRVSPLWYAFFVTLCVGAPLLHAPFAVRNLLGLKSVLSALHLGNWMTYDAIELLVLAGGLWRFTRSWRLFTAIAAATAACMITWGIIWSRYSGGWNIEPYWDATVALWHAVCAGSIIAWGVAARRRVHPWWVCRGCGYDLRGCTGRCPECGVPLEAQRVPSARSG